MSDIIDNKTHFPPLPIKPRENMSGFFSVNLAKNRGKKPSDFKIDFAIIEHEDGGDVRFTRRQIEAIFGKDLMKKLNE